MLSEWKKVKIAEIANLGTGSSAPQGEEFFVDGKYPFLRVYDMGQNKGKKYLMKIRDRVNENAIKSQKLKLVPKDSVLFTKSGASLLKNQRVLLKEDTYIVSHIGFATPKNEYKVNSHWLYYLFNTIDFNNFAQGTSLPALKLSTVGEMEVLLPQIEEQQKIATILSKVDEAIEKTEAIIDQVEKTKTGLMQQLLTKGIGHTEFKKSDVGEIPIDWHLVNLDSVATRKSGHTPNKKKSEYWSGDIPWVSLKDTFRLDNRYIFETTDYTTVEGIANSSAVMLPKNTLIISRDATVGKVGITDLEMATSQHFINYICGESLDYLYLYYYLRYRKPLFERMATGSTIKTIGLAFFKEFKIVLPPFDEQVKIRDILSSQDDKIIVEKNKLKQLKGLKKGLLQDLFTGDVRVQVHDPEVIRT